jgi:mannose-1-phosphate guanylyltransferase
MYAAIMAGGTGTRLWPKSREKKPKQLLPFISDKSLLEETVQDIKGLVPNDKILIVTNKNYTKEIKKQLPAVKHFLLEPFKLGKTLAIGATALYLAKLDPQAVMVLLWSDSYIGNKKEYRRILKKAEGYAKKGQNLIIGIKPEYPATCYGYIKMGRQIDSELYKLEEFQEKPDIKTANKFFSSDKFVWNPGISLWRVDKLLELYKEFEPETYKLLMKLEKFINTNQFSQKAQQYLKNVKKTEIEDTIYPKAKDLGVIPADIAWNDIGHWGAIKDIIKKEGNLIQAKHIGVDTENCYVHGSDRLIATIGLNNIVIIDTPDVLLIAHKDKTQKVKNITELLKEQNKMEYL